MRKSAGSKRKKLKKIRALFALFLIVVITPPFIALFYLFPTHLRALRRLCGQMFLRPLRLDIRLFGELDKEAQIIMLNHQSFLDVIFLEVIHPSNLCWIAKKQLGDVFLYGHALKAPRMILIDREDKKGLLSLLKISKERLEEGRVLAIFPEGTRGKGERFLPFKQGAKVLAEKFDLRIQPIVIVHSRALFDLAGLSVGGTQAHFITLPARKSSDSPRWYEEMREEMQAIHDEHLAQIRALG